jgi:hypothetical protein
MKIAVCGISIGSEYNNKVWVKYALNNHKKYCAIHNYDYILRTNSKTNRAPTWEKIDIIKELILTNKYDYIFWMDTDSIFTNFSIKIENIISNAGSNYNFIFSGDTNIINAGHFIFKSCEWSLKELDKIWTIFPANYGMSGDNAAFSCWLSGGNGSMTHEEQKKYYEMVDKGYTDTYEKYRIESGIAQDYICKELFKFCKLIPKKVINSYVADYQKGDFILHAVNSNDNNRNNLFSYIENNNLIVY